uniref:Uncharacterized protein n=1 Tax=Amphimedon queenslandica TaxID=400682 RepID=A0A1X7TZ60_AMPQE
KTRALNFITLINRQLHLDTPSQYQRQRVLYYYRLKGKRCLFPFAFHYTRMLL